jgi:hypothetical protein
MDGYDEKDVISNENNNGQMNWQAVVKMIRRWYHRRLRVDNCTKIFLVKMIKR